MSAIPLEIERRFEQRWAARFLLPNKSSGQHSQRPKRTQVTGPQEPKEKPAVIEQRARSLHRWRERGASLQIDRINPAALQAPVGMHCW